MSRASHKPTYLLQSPGFVSALIDWTVSDETFFFLFCLFTAEEASIRMRDANTATRRGESFMYEIDWSDDDMTWELLQFDLTSILILILCAHDEANGERWKELYCHLLPLPSTAIYCHLLPSIVWVQNKLQSLTLLKSVVWENYKGHAYDAYVIFTISFTKKTSKYLFLLEVCSSV